MRRSDVPEAWNRVTEAVIGAAIEVHSELGPGLLERLYEEAMAHELRMRGLTFERQRTIRLRYKGIDLGDQVLDLVVEGIVVLELKSVEKVHDVHLRQLVSYMKSGRIPLGLLINFNTPLLKDGLFRRVLTISTPTPTVMLTDLPPQSPSASFADSAITPHRTSH